MALLLLVLSALCRSLWAEEYNVIHCDIFDKKGQLVRHYPGDHCVFLKDGSFVSGSINSLTFYRPDLTVKWTKPIPTHHQLKLDNSQKRLLVMSSSEHRYLRFDKLLVLSLEGETLLQFDSFPYIDELFGATRSSPHFWAISEALKAYSSFDVVGEISHFNSFYEIPENSAAAKNPIFRAGNFLVNSVLPSVTFVIDASLKKVLWIHGHPNVLKHDTQMQANGKIIFYENSAHILNRPYSSIQEYDPITREYKLLFRAAKPDSFASEKVGGVQVLPNGHFLTSDYSQGGRALEITREGKIVWSIPYIAIDPVTRKPSLFQDVKRLDLSHFLAKHKSF